MNIIPIKSFENNYIWSLISSNSKTMVVVDPGDSSPVIDYLHRYNLLLTGILITHKHRDHINGITRLISLYPNIPVYGPYKESIHHLTKQLREGDEIFLPDINIKLRVLDLPGHTEGHIAYYNKSMIFCGDTLFAGGCGRVFSGTYKELYTSLKKIALLPTDTRIYCAHEYTLDNLGFAQWVEPKNETLKQRIKRDKSLHSIGNPTIPSTLLDELLTNPFMRTNIPTIITAAEKYIGHFLTTEEDVFTTIRIWKDREYD